MNYWTRLKRGYDLKVYEIVIFWTIASFGVYVLTLGIVYALEVQC